MASKSIPAPPSQPQPPTPRGAHRSGQNIFRKPPPPTNFFASAYRTNTISDTQPPALAVSQSTSDRLQLLLLSPRGLPKVQTPRKNNNTLRTSGDDDMMLEGTTNQSSRGASSSRRPPNAVGQQPDDSVASIVRQHENALEDKQVQQGGAETVGTTDATTTLKENRCFLPSLVLPTNTPRQYTISDPPAIVTGRHAKPQFSPRKNINAPHHVAAKSRAAFGKAYGDEPKVYCTMQRLDGLGDGGCGVTGAARSVRNSEEERLMKGHILSPREHYKLKPPVTPDLPDSIVGDPLSELDAFDEKRWMSAQDEGDDENKKTHRQLSQPEMSARNKANKTNRSANNILRAKASPSGTPSLRAFQASKGPNTKSQQARGSGSAATNVGNGSFGEQQQYPLYLEETMDEDFMGTGQHPEETDVGACKRDYQLTKVIFRAAKVRDTYPCRLLRNLGEVKVLERHQTVVHRLGYRRLNRDEFHNHIIDIVEAAEGSVERRDTDALFDLFDTNSSGFLDDKEIVSGFHWIMQGPDEARRIIAAYCKQFLAARNVMEAVVSLMEIEIMAKAVCETCEERYPGVTAEARNIVGFLSNHARLGQVSSLSGFVPYPLFYQVVQKSLIFGKVIRILKMDGTLPPELPRTRSPDPDREMRTMIHVASTLEDHSGRSHKFQSGQDVHTGAPNSNNGNQENNGNANLNSTTNRVGLIDCTHPRFKADTCARPPNYRPTPEHDSPIWALRNGVLWLTNPTEAPTLHTRKTSL